MSLILQVFFVCFLAVSCATVSKPEPEALPSSENGENGQKGLEEEDVVVKEISQTLTLEKTVDNLYDNAYQSYLNGKYEDAIIGFETGDMWVEALDGHGGGVFGMLAWPLKTYLGSIASVVLLIGLTLISVILMFNTAITHVVMVNQGMIRALGWAGRTVVATFKAVFVKSDSKIALDQEEETEVEEEVDNKPHRPLFAKKQISEEDDEEEEIPEEEELYAGLSIDVSLPRKKIRGLEVLSGGERALTSIALIFSMTQVNPPPFLILDETDAALDEANSKRYADMVGELGQKSQLIVITHNRETMSHAHVLYGVTIGADGASRSREEIQKELEKARQTPENEYVKLDDPDV